LGTGKKGEELVGFLQQSTYKSTRQGGWDPAARLIDMASDGVEAEGIYTTLGFRQFWVQDAALQRACFRAYSDWLAAYCSSAPKPLFGLALLALYDIDTAVAAVRRCRALGLKGAMLWASPPEDQPYSAPLYDPVWAAAQDLRMPLSLHAITGMGLESQATRAMGRERQPIDRYLRGVTQGDEVEHSLTVFIFSGVLERFPHLKLVSAENNVGWLPYVIRGWDQSFSGGRSMYATPLKLTPSEYFHRQVYATFIDDPRGVQNCAQIGIENMLWSSDYLPTASTWPHSQECMARISQRSPQTRSAKSCARTPLISMTSAWSSAAHRPGRRSARRSRDDHTCREGTSGWRESLLQHARAFHNPTRTRLTR
jgi:predicted TIM-barrel fold metal-dependent hydrolase